MAGLKNTGAAAAKPQAQVQTATRTNQQQQQQNMPAWINTYQQQQQPTQQASNKGKDTLANAQPARNTQVLKKNNDQLGEHMPAWQQTLQNVTDAISVGSNIAVNPIGWLTANVASPYLQSLLPASKGNDQLGPGGPNKNLDKLGRMSGRTMFGPGVGPGTLDPSLWNAGGQGGFGSNYGGNWKGGGWGGGGSGWTDWGNSGGNNYPAWANYLMRLNSWNIK